MAGENVGTIYYTVEADTSRLVNGTQVAEASLDGLERRFSKTDKAANEANFTMTKTAAAIKGMGGEASGASSSLGSLAKVLGGLLTLQGVNSLVQMAEGYNEMAERVRMASGSAAEYELVQQRLLATANGTYRAMSEAQEVYILTADALRSMGYSTSDVLDITDSLSYAMVKNAASGQRAQSAISAYSKSIQIGKVQADAWQSILAATPSIIQDIAAATGKSADEIRTLGAEGKLTAQQLNEGLRQSLEGNKAAADGMATTVRDAFTAMRNNLAAYLGEANQATGATNLMSTAILGLGNNIDVIVKTLTAAGAGAMAMYVAKTGAAAIASAQSAVQSLRVAQAKAAEAAASTAAASAAGTHAAAATTEAASMNAGATAAANKTRSLMTMAAAQRAATVAGTGLLAALGGPAGLIGVVASVAAGWLLFKTKADDARKSMEAFDVPLDQAIEKFEKLSKIQQDKKMNDALSEQARTAKDAEDAWKRLYSAVRNINEFSTDWSRKQWSDWRIELQNARNAGEDLSPVLQKLYQAGVSREQIVHLVDLASNLDILNAEAAKADGAVAAFMATLRRMADAANEAASGLANAGAAAQTIGAEAQKQIDSLEKQIALHKKAGTAASLLYDVEQARLHQKGQFAELNAKELDEIERLAKIRQQQEASATRLAKMETEAQRKAKQAAEELKRSHESNIQTIDRMAQSLQFAALSGEALAKAQAAASLNSVATPEQVAQLEAMAVALYKVQQAQEARKKVGSTASEVEQYVFGDVQPLSGGAFDDQTARYDAEAKAEEKRYAEQLKRLQEAKAAEVQQRQAYATMIEELQAAHLGRMAALEQEREQAKTDGDAQKLEADIALEQTRYEDELTRLQEHLEKKYQMQVDYGALEGKLAQENADRKAQIESAKNQVMLASASAAFGSLSDIMQKSAGEQSGIYKTMFAASKAFAIAEAIVAIQTGIAKAAAEPFPANIAAMASVAAATSSIVSTIQGTSYGGGRQYGGPVAAGKGYRINENGAPEILNTASGRQYLLPNSRGEVVSNKDATGGGGAAPVNVTVQLIEDASRGGQVQQSYANEQYVLNICVASIRRGTDLAQAVEGTYGIGRRGR